MIKLSPVYFWKCHITFLLIKYPQKMVFQWKYIFELTNSWISVIHQRKISWCSHLCILTLTRNQALRTTWPKLYAIIAHFRSKGFRCFIHFGPTVVTNPKYSMESATTYIGLSMNNMLETASSVNKFCISLLRFWRKSK